MPRRFEYRVCHVRDGRVTHVGGESQGDVLPPQPGGDAAAPASCPAVWDYLDGAGYDGWELVAALASESAGGPHEVLYLRRER